VTIVERRTEHLDEQRLFGRFEQFETGPEFVDCRRAHDLILRVVRRDGDEPGQQRHPRRAEVLQLGHQFPPLIGLQSPIPESGSDLRQRGRGACFNVPKEVRQARAVAGRQDFFPQHIDRFRRAGLVMPEGHRGFRAQVGVVAAAVNAERRREPGIGPRHVGQELGGERVKCRVPVSEQVG
jgi:hypothetical protein